MPSLRPRRIARPLGAAAVSVLAAVVVAACGSASAGGAKHLALVAYSTPQAAFAKLIPAFEATAAGKGWSFSQSFGASGDQSRAVAAGLPADVVDLSLEPDVTKLVQAGRIAANWNSGPHKGIVTDSVAVIAVRPGNPKHIETWSDLVKPGVGVITPNPFTSGSARWNVMAIYGAALKQGMTPAQALAFVSTVFKHTVAQPSSSRNATQTFVAGKGDALITYENEAITAKANGQPLDYVVPGQTILIENPLAVVKGPNAAEARRFVDFLYTPEAQTIFAKAGYRPVLGGLAGAPSFPTPSGLFTIASLGGWKTVAKQFFDPQTGSIAKVEQGVGVSTSK
jgi:sulfate/thiosulfate transport system substrate-binding protein